MKIEETIFEKLIAASGTSVLRAAASIITESLSKHEAVENEEQTVAKSISDTAEEMGTEKYLIAAMMIASVGQSVYQNKMRQARQFNGADVSDMQKVGNC